MTKATTPRSPFWPPGVPRQLNLPAHSLFGNLLATAARKPGTPAFVYYGRALTYADLLDQVERLAGWLQARGVRRGDRVLLYMQNSPQFAIGYYAILRADAVCVPVNPMCRDAELRHIATDTGARVAICGAELWPFLQPLCDQGMFETVLATAYADYADPSDPLPLPEPLASVREPEGAESWRAALAADARPGPHLSTADDIALIPYSSGTTGQPKGCVHTHRSVNATAIGGNLWFPAADDDVILGVLPLFHVTGMQNSLNGAISGGVTVVLMTRWNRTTAARLIERYRVTRWRSITTMAIDMVNAPDIADYDLGSLRSIGGGGAQMPAAVAERLKALTGLDYVEGYGLTETMAATHLNPPQAARAQCLGIPVHEVESTVIDPDTGTELPPGEVGEIVMRGPQVFQGYWQRPEATEAAFVTLNGQRYFRSGDIGYRDKDGYFYMVDRLKRMVNAAGFKVWPAEVEALMLRCPLVAEACVIGIPDPRRGQAVQAVVVPRDGATEEAIIAWCRDTMAAYKCPTSVRFVTELPKSGSGKVLWRELELAARAATS